MQNTAISTMFKDILDINTKSMVLLPIAHTITLISYNAQIAAAHSGESGRTLSVMTGEINQLAPVISECIEKISSIINEIGNSNAYCANKMREQMAFDRAAELLAEDGRELPELKACNDKSQGELENSLGDLSKNLYALRPVFDEIADQTQRAESIGTILRIEVGRLSSINDDLTAFKALSDELAISCETMRNIIDDCQKVLQIIDRDVKLLNA